MTMRQNATAIPQDTDLLPPAAPLAPDFETPAATETRTAVASQWQLMRWRFRKHKLAVISMWIIAFLCFVALFGEFLAPGDPDKSVELYKYVRPQGISFFDQDHHFHIIPGV